MIDHLVIIEHDGDSVKPSSLAAMTLAAQLGGSISLGVIGSGLTEIVESVRGYGASSVLSADHSVLAEPLADRFASLIAEMARKKGARSVIGTSSTFTKDVLPRVAALLDAPMLSDVTSVQIETDTAIFSRPVNAGNSYVTARLEGGVQVFTVRGAAFTPPALNGTSSPVEVFEFDPATLPNGTWFVSRERQATARPDLTEARVVVSGGRPLKDKDTFEELIGGLADALGGAVGATRAAVDVGMAPNDCQVGQTGKVVAPELYFAIGISGAIQHVAGIKDSKVIVAINRDPDAPVVQVANYSLIGDLHEIVPRLISAVRS